MGNMAAEQWNLKVARETQSEQMVGNFECAVWLSSVAIIQKPLEDEVVQLGPSPVQPN